MSRVQGPGLERIFSSGDRFDNCTKVQCRHLPGLGYSAANI